jgi:hypothetical protein
MLSRRQGALVCAALLMALYSPSLRAGEQKAQASGPSSAGKETNVERKVARTVTNHEVALKHMELADVYAEAIGNDMRCELNAYEYKVIENYYHAKEADASVPATPAIERAIGQRASFKAYASSSWVEKYAAQHFEGTVLFGTEAGVFA